MSLFTRNPDGRTYYYHPHDRAYFIICQTIDKPQKGWTAAVNRRYEPEVDGVRVHTSIKQAQNCAIRLAIDTFPELITTQELLAFEEFIRDV